MEQDQILELKRKIKTISDFPKKGITYRDVTPLLTDSESFNKTINLLKEYYKNKNIEAVVAVEPRGFIFGSSLAISLGVAFVPLRRKGKSKMNLSKEFGLDYKVNALEMPKNAIKKGERVIFFDDVLAGGVTTEAAVKAIEKHGANVVGVGFLVELTGLEARKKLDKYEVHSLIKFNNR
ncbi:MAG: adenine phosphoribosyltransferase [Candidatus Micrarchaeia archaeon]|jgi:adenine phosphoribosyltransferase